MKKKILAIFGPIILASLMLGILIFGPFQLSMKYAKNLEAAASGMSENVLRGNAIKNQALASDKFVAFFGSSEFSRVSPFHPSVIAKKYHRGYTPFLLGAPGTQSLLHFMMLNSLTEELQGKKMVFIISPQWFEKGGLDKNSFATYFSELQTYQWLLSIKQVSEAERFCAERLLSFDAVQSKPQLTEMLEKIKHGDEPLRSQKNSALIQMKLLQREDEIFSSIGNLSQSNKINQETKKLPKAYDYQTLDKLASQIGQKATSNNSFGIDNHFYQERLKKRIDKLKNSQKQHDYRDSVEFADFQLVLEQIAKMKAEVLFVLPPVNQQWLNYTGLSTEMLTTFNQKIRYQLTSQGFNQIADLSKEGSQKYFMADTIHLGWRGWLNVDQYIQPFLQDKESKSKQYQMNDFFFSQKWQKENKSF